MSLLKVREFWSLEVDQLVAQSSITDLQLGTRGPTASIEDGIANFCACWGQFEAIGQEEVLVCANLNGFLCIVQVPEDKQLQCLSTNTSGNGNNKEPNKNAYKAESLTDNNRQVLLASQLSVSVVDLKCGFFTSTMKQSIAVLSPNNLIVFYVKPHQVDLISASANQDGGESNDEALFSHQLEEQYRIDLCSAELTTNLVVLGSNYLHGSAGVDFSAGSSTKFSKDAKNLDQESSRDSKSTGLYSRPSQNTPSLPQRDQLVVQYANQLIFTLVDYKKVTGHFRLNLHNASNINASEITATNERSRLDLGAQFVGPMPMAYLYESKMTSSLAISLSDHKIRCIPLEKLVAQAKQSVVKRAAQNLLFDVSSSKDSSKSSTQNAKLDQIASAVVANSGWIQVNLNAISSWTFELPREPLQMQSIARRTNNSLSDRQSGSNQIGKSQLMIMTRYTMDLFTNSGQHIWSQRFEEPLICFYPYILPSKDTDQKSIDNKDRLLTIVCSDCLSNDKCNLSIYDDDNLYWSALLDAKPTQIWRAYLSKTNYVLASLDVNQGKVSVSYLGTNMLDLNEVMDEECDSEIKPSQLAILEQINAPLLGKDETSLEDDANGSSNSANLNLTDSDRALKISASLEAQNNWPQVCVDSCISIRVNEESANSAGTILHNIIVTIEFDDLIRYNSQDTAELISPGVMQVQLGTYWPDKGEPLTLRGQFTYRCNSTSVGTEAIEQIDNQITDADLSHESLNADLLPKSLLVRLYIRFSDTRFGPAIQEFSFQLPLNLVGRLVHLDYTSGQNQSIADVLCNLQLYKRSQIFDSDLVSLIEDNSIKTSPYYVSDIFVRDSGGDIIEIADEIIESDLVCRGLNVESDAYKVQDRKEMRLNTIENMNLLAQSLDCRLKFKGQTTREDALRLQQQLSDDGLSSNNIVMITIALKLSSGNCSLPNIAFNLADSEKNQSEAIVWLHLIDLNASESVIPEQFVRQHLKEWRPIDDAKAQSSQVHQTSEPRCPVLVSIECDRPLPVLFMQNHLISRLQQRQLKLKPSELLTFKPFTDQQHDSIEINYINIMKMPNFITISSNLHDLLLSEITYYESEFKRKFKELKSSLMLEHCKFHLSTFTSLALCKRLSNLPEDEHQQFALLNVLTRMCQSNLQAKLQDLEQMKKKDYYCSKFPDISAKILQIDDSLVMPSKGCIRIRQLIE